MKVIVTVGSTPRPRQSVEAHRDEWMRHYFWPYVLKSGPVWRLRSQCWLWLGEKDKNGCGIAKKAYNGTRRAQRISYQNLNSYLPTNVRIENRCENSHCVNPFHLRIRQ